MSAGLSRRGFLRIAAGTAGVIAFDLGIAQDEKTARAGGLEIHSWIAIHPDNRVVVRIPQSEMGQGATTALVQIIAEELELDLALVDWEFYQPATNWQRGNVYGHTATLASWGIKMLFEPMRTAGAQIRSLLCGVAGERFAADPLTLVIAGHHVRDPASGRSLAFAELAAAAAARPLPDPAAVTLRAPGTWRYIGKSVARNDAHAKSTGQARYGIDVVLPGMKYAAVRQSPVFGGRLRSFEPAAVLERPGIHRVVRILAGPSGYTVPPTLWDVIDWQMDDAVAVVADSWWQAERALAELPIEWDEGPHAAVDSAAIARDLLAALDRPGQVVRSEGDAAGAMATATQVLQADYEYPFLEHATMEPMNCTARVDADGVEAWAPTQYGDEALRIAAYAAGVAIKDARFHVTLAGGGFGRRLHNDYVSQAVQVARQMPGTPVKLIWSREENTRRSYYPPVVRARLRAGLNERREVVAWQAHVVQGRSVFQPYALSRLAMPFANIEVRYDSIATPPAFAWMRGVGHTQGAWINHGFVSELAALRGTDTLSFQLDWLDASKVAPSREDYADAVERIRRFRRLLEDVASRAGAAPEGKGQGRGIAVYDMSYVPGYRNACIAIALDVELDGHGALRVTHVQASVDCGLLVNPQIATAQIEGGILFGLSNALYGKITLRDGRVEQSNFHDYPLLKLAHAPAIVVHFLASDDPPTGVGEGAVPVVIGALVDAIHAAGGPRIRSLPVMDADLSWRVAG